MGKIGFIGFGNMGSIMLQALLDARAIPENRVILTTRTLEKLKDFAIKYSKVEIAKSLPELAVKCERVFICTGTMEVKPVLGELVGYLPENTHVITITAMIEIKCIENIFPGRISKVMPTQISEVGEGVTLVCHNKKALPEDREFIRSAFGSIGKVKEIKENQFDLGSDLTSCAPAFYAAILRNLVKVAEHYGDFTPDELKELIIPTFHGTAKLLIENRIDFNDLILRVATKGGITEEGLKILDREIPGIFDELLKVTLNKRDRTKKIIREQYGLE